MDSANAASAASPRNKSSLGQRVASAAVLLPIVAGVVWWSVWSVAVVVAIALAIGIIELFAALRHGGYRPRLLVGLVAGLLIVLAIAIRPLVSFDPLFPVITLAITGSLAIELTRNQQQGVVASWALALAGAFYLGWLFSHFILLRRIETPLQGGLLHPTRLGIEPGAAWIYLVLAITWIQDSAAYFAGKNLGRHKMAPLLSPKKTWEGAAGGLIGSVVASLLCVLLLGLPIGYPEAALLGLIGGVVGPLGDLAESMIKRQVGLKDAGNLIPGHGGILDRADSLLFTGPVLYYLILLLAR
jgi:phosphatidate cytidylyltransferase